MSAATRPDASRRFTDTFDVIEPVVNAPMAFVAGGALAAAVAQAGGLGLIGGGYGDLGWIEAQLALADRPVGVGLITWAGAGRPEVVDRLVTLGVRTLFLSFGDPTATLRQLDGTGVRVLYQAQSVDDAVRACDAGALAIVAQGYEAGGHGRDNASVTELVPAVVSAVAPTPVLAAGGMATAIDMAWAWSVGAAGIVVGTRFYATPEALDVDAAKDRLVAATGSDTIRTNVFDIVRGPEWPAGYTGRALRNETTERWHRRETELRAELDSVRDHYRDRAAAADLDTRVVWAGTAVEEVTAIAPAAEVVQSLLPTRRTLGDG